jgi:uncharacterized membrane protein
MVLSSIFRHILKTITYRILGSLTTITIAFCLGASIEVSTLIGFTELIVKPILYFFHERLWYKYIRIKR